MQMRTRSAWLVLVMVIALTYAESAVVAYTAIGAAAIILAIKE